MTAIQKKTVTNRDGTTIYYEVHRQGGLSPQASFEKVLGSPQGLGQTFSQELDASASPTLFLVHGIGGDVDGWKFVRDTLLEKGCSVVSMDVRGHGYSDHPKKSAFYKISRIEEDIATICDKEKLVRPVLVGHSGGAVIAAQFAASFPHMLGGLVLINGSYCPPAWLANPTLHRIANIVIKIGGAISPPPAKKWHSPYPEGKHHKEVEIFGLLRTMFYNSLRSYLYTSYELINVDLSNELPKIAIPTLLIASQNDGIFPVHIQQEMHKKIPHSTLVVLPDTNHVSVLNNPEGVAAAVLKFLRF